MRDPLSADQRGLNSTSQSTFMLVADAISDYAIFLLDSQGHATSWNPGVEALLGYNSAEYQGQPISHICPHHDRAVMAGLHRARKDGSYETTAWCVRKDGSRVQARVRILKDSDLNGGDQFLILMQDVTVHLSTEQALVESEQRFHTLVQGVRDYAIYMLDPEGRVTNWNSGAALIKGYDAEEIIGRHFSCFYTPEEQACGEPQRSLEMACRNNTFQTEAWRVRKDGSRFWASVVIDPIYDTNQHLLGYAKVTRDITEQKAAQEKSIQKREALHQSQKLEAIGRLTGSVAHDFNNFLSIIRTAAELLESSTTLTPAKQVRYTRMISDTASRASRLTEQLLTFARRQTLQAQVFSVDQRIYEFKQVIETTLGSNLTLSIHFDDDLAPVETDVNQFETAVLNMVINARDATPDDGTVTIRGHTATLDWLYEDGTTRKRMFTALSVSDTGEGVDPAVLPKIFEPFVTTKAIDKGTGLGLSQVYGFAKQSGGDVLVESEPGKGACFTLYLPCASGETHSWAGILSPLAQDLFPDS